MGLLHKIKKIVRVNRESSYHMPAGMELSLFICTNWKICFRNILNIAALHRYNGKGLYFLSFNPRVFYWYLEVPHVRQNLKFGLPAKPAFIYTDSPALHKLLSKRRNNVRLVRYAKNAAQFAAQDLFPYFLNPDIEWKRPLRAYTDNSIYRTIFFAGNQLAAAYAKDNFLTRKFGLPNRIETIHFLKSRFSFKPLGNVLVAQLDNGFNLTINNNAVNYRLAGNEYEDRMEQCDFFIGLPGLIMPLCHNAMEAIAKGKILLTPCPNWFSPKLTPGVNCFSYQTNEELLALIDHCALMSDENIMAMKMQVKKYQQQQAEQKKNVLGKDILMVNEDRASLKYFHP